MNTQPSKKKKTGTFRPVVTMKPQGYVELSLKSGSVVIKLGFNEMADVDAALGRASLHSFMNDPLNLSVLRCLFFHGIKERRKDITDQRAAGELLSGVPISVISEAILSAMRASGVMTEDDDPETADAVGE